MNGRPRTIINLSTDRYSSICQTHNRNKVTPISGGGHHNDRRFDHTEAGLIVCGDLSEAKRQERITGSYRNIPALYLFLPGCGNGESLSDLQAADLERHAAPGARLTSERDHLGDLEEGKRLYLPAQPGAYFLFVWRSYCECGGRDGEPAFIM